MNHVRLLVILVVNVSSAGVALTKSGVSDARGAHRDDVRLRDMGVHPAILLAEFLPKLVGQDVGQYEVHIPLGPPPTASVGVLAVRRDSVST